MLINACNSMRSVLDSRGSGTACGDLNSRFNNVFPCRSTGSSNMVAYTRTTTPGPVIITINATITNPEVAAAATALAAAQNNLAALRRNGATPIEIEAAELAVQASQVHYDNAVRVAAGGNVGSSSGGGDGDSSDGGMIVGLVVGAIVLFVRQRRLNVNKLIC